MEMSSSREPILWTLFTRGPRETFTMVRTASQRIFKARSQRHKNPGTLSPRERQVFGCRRWWCHGRHQGSSKSFRPGKQAYYAISAIHAESTYSMLVASWSSLMLELTTSLIPSLFLLGLKLWARLGRSLWAADRNSRMRRIQKPLYKSVRTTLAFVRCVVS